jgi:hypothetical protein
MIVGEEYLVGSDEIPNQLPGIVTAALAGAGIDWPALDGLTDYIEEFGLSGDDRPSLAERYMQDPLGNTLSTLLLIGMVASVIYLGWSYLNNSIRYSPWPRWILPIAVLVGITASAYLTYVELTQSEVVCGPVGDCNAVQSSRYAYLFGVIPVALIGLVGYLVISGDGGGASSQLSLCG